MLVLAIKARAFSANGNLFQAKTVGSLSRLIFYEGVRFIVFVVVVPIHKNLAALHLSFTNMKVLTMKQLIWTLFMKMNLSKNKLVLHLSLTNVNLSKI